MSTVSTSSRSTPKPTPPEPIVEVSKKIKSREPDTFDGTKSKLRVYLMQCALYIKFNENMFRTEDEQVLWCTGYLTGAAFDWIETSQQDYLDCEGKTAKWDPLTKEIFGTFEGFKEKITKVFGNVDEEKVAERKLSNLRQTGAASAYAAEFQQHMGRISGWGENAFMVQFYKGLKDSVKDELMRRDKHDSIQAMMDDAIHFDNKLYERSLEKRGHYSSKYKGGSGRGSKKDHHWDPMQVDAISRKPKQKQVSKEEMERRRKDKLCFTCGLPGHRSDSHRKGKKRTPGKQVNAIGRGGYNQTRQICMASRKAYSDKEWYDNIGTQVESDEEPAPKRRRTGGQGSKKQRSLQEEAEAGLERFIDEIGKHLDVGGDLPELYAPDREIAAWEEKERRQGQQDDSAYSPKTVPADAWPKDHPQVGQTWHVVQREDSEVCSTRQWQNCSGGYVYQEPSPGPGGPEYGELYEVIYQDHRNIGWRQMGGAQCYMQQLPIQDEPLPLTEPRTGDCYQIRAESTRHRLWQNTETDEYHEEKFDRSSRPYLGVGQVYKLIHQGEADRTWESVLTKGWHRELCATGGFGQLFCVVQIGVNQINAMIDSGATGSYISKKTVMKYQISTRVKERPYDIITVDGSPLGSGVVDVETRYQRMTMHRGHVETIQFDVVDMPHAIILGMPWIRQHNPTIDWVKESIKFDRCQNTCQMFRIDTIKEGQREVCATSSGEPGYPAQDPLLKQIPEEYHSYQDLFTDKKGAEALPKHQSWDHVIPLKEGMEPPFLPMYRTSEEDLRTLEEYVDKNLKKGYIRESSSPAGSPTLFVPKPDGTKRMCIDFRRINDMTIKDRYALPLADDLRDRLQGAKIFTQLDLREGYHLIRMKEGEEWKTAFRTPRGHYECLVMWEGLTNAPATFQRLVHNVLRPYLDRTCVAYLDDILVYSADAERHVKDVKAVLEALKSAGLRLKPEKCHFHQEQVTFLGYVVSTQGISMDPKKVSAILDWQEPTNVKEVQSFLGFCNFYRRFVRNYSAVAAPLTGLTKKDQGFEWTPKCQAAFIQLKRHFTEAPFLLTFDPKKPISVETDASDFAIGAVLSQPGENQK